MSEVDGQLGAVLELLGAVLAPQVLLVPVGVDPPDVLPHVAGGDQSSAVLTYFLTADIILLAVIFLLVFQIYSFALETFITVKASVFLLLARSPRTLFCNLRGVLFIQLHVIIQEIINAKDGLLLAWTGYLREPGVAVVAHFLLRGQTGAESGEEDDPAPCRGPLYENVSDVGLQETILHSQHQTLVKPRTR